MIISPPFLPVRAANQTEQAWLDAAFTLPGILTSTNAPEGSFPLGNDLAWHNGLHIQGQSNAEGHTVVRAIADGEVIFVSPPQRCNTDINDPLNYNPFGEGISWTDNGCVIVKHSTEIGAQGEQATEVVYYSTYMHLNQIGRTTPAGQGAARALQRGDRIWRKDEIGRVGQIYNHAGQVHLEIALDEANLTRLIGRAPAWVDPANIPAPTADGRIDAVFGAIWFYLPATTPTTANTPTNHLRSTSPTTLGEALWVKMHYENGSCTFTSYNGQGQQRGNRQPEHDGEYNLYNTANHRHNALAQADRNRSSPSGWYELLRFGRNLGRGPNAADKDPLPANAAHWRQITGPNGQVVWADLNTEGSYKFSDADFLTIQGWCFIDDDNSPDDQHCDSNNLKNRIADPDTNAEGRLETATLVQHIGDREVMEKLKRVVCRFPSEWDQTTIAARYGFVRELAPFQNNPEAWNAFEAHMRAISFANLPAEYLAATWRLHPKTFIEVMRGCGWFSRDELAQSFPRFMFYTSDGNPRTAITTNNNTYTLSRSEASRRIQNHVNPLNLCLRKYIGHDKKRIGLFLAQVLLETAQWRNLGGTRRLMHEWGFGEYSTANPATQYYTAFYGRGIMQLTWAGNYRDYGEFRSIPNHQGQYVERLNQNNNRITNTSQHYTANPSDHGQLITWSPRYDPDIVGENPFEACDSGGYYWVSKSFSEGFSISRVCDREYNAANIGFINRLVNGGGNGYYERLAYSEFICRYLMDGVTSDLTIAMMPPVPKARVTANLTKTI
jgi:predicted chitinase